jgi:putative ABC transport system permease protein
MRTWRILKQSLVALGRNRLRSVLIMLGVVVGIAALTVVVSMGREANRRVVTRVNNFGPTAIMLFAGGGKDVPGPDPSVVTLTFDDAGAVETQVRGVDFICPQVMRPGTPASYGDRSYTVTVIGAPPTYQRAWDWYVSDGDFFDDQDVSSAARVVVIGQTVVRELFPGVNPIGETLRIGNGNFRVKGVLTAKGTSPMGGDMDERVIVPLTTAMRRMFNVTTLTMVRVRTANVGEIKRVAMEIRSLMRERHQIRPPDLDDFRVVASEQVAMLSEAVSGTLNRVLLAVTVIALMVSGMVLMNLMLLSVTERRREIGLRRAVGGKRRDILLQFLFESLALTSSGGVVGLLLGIGVVLVMGRVTPGTAELSWEPAAVGVGLSLVVGLVFGLLPARRAARVHPVDALR